VKVTKKEVICIVHKIIDKVKSEACQGFMDYFYGSQSDKDFPAVKYLGCGAYRTTVKYKNIVIKFPNYGGANATTKREHTLYNKHKKSDVKYLMNPVLLCEKYKNVWFSVSPFLTTSNKRCKKIARCNKLIDSLPFDDIQDVNVGIMKTFPVMIDFNVDGDWANNISFPDFIADNNHYRKEFLKHKVRYDKYLKMLA
jgi:hypothetical protein